MKCFSYEPTALVNKLLGQNTQELRKSLDEINQQKIKLNKDERNNTDIKNENDTLNMTLSVLSQNSSIFWAWIFAGWRIRWIKITKMGKSTQKKTLWDTEYSY